MQLVRSMETSIQNVACDRATEKDIRVFEKEARPNSTLYRQALRILEDYDSHSRDEEARRLRAALRRVFDGRRLPPEGPPLILVNSSPLILANSSPRSGGESATECQAATSAKGAGRGGESHGGAGCARRVGADRGGADRGGADRGGAERAGVDRGGVDRGGAERAGVDRAGVDRGGADREGTGRSNARRGGCCRIS
jgi:hypothetical protein